MCVDTRPARGMQGYSGVGYRGQERCAECSGSVAEVDPGGQAEFVNVRQELSGEPRLPRFRVAVAEFVA